MMAMLGKGNLVSSCQENTFLPAGIPSSFRYESSSGSNIRLLNHGSSPAPVTVGEITRQPDIGQLTQCFTLMIRIHSQAAGDGGLDTEIPGLTIPSSNRSLCQ